MNKAALYIAEAPRLGRKKVIIDEGSSSETVCLHLSACFKKSAFDSYGSGFKLKGNEVASSAVSGEYIGLFFSLENPDDQERQIAERIKVRKAHLWERFL